MTSIARSRIGQTRGTALCSIRAPQIGQYGQAPLVDVLQAVEMNGFNEPGLRAEMVLHGRSVALAGGRTDLAQRHRSSAPLGEQPFCRFNDPLSCCASHRVRLLTQVR